jgi:hypothetical protein
MRDGGGRQVSETLGEVHAEVEALHDFFTGWFNGTLPETDAAFQGGFADHAHAEFRMVQPSGAAHDLDDILTALRGAWGGNPGFRIEIRDVRVLGEWPAAGLVLAAYIEAQFGALNSTPPDNLRRSTVLFERRGGRLLWRHLHETALEAG